MRWLQRSSTRQPTPTAARLVHPQRRVWKDIDRRRFDEALPGLGIGAMTTMLRPRQAAPGLPRRLHAQLSMGYRSEEEGREGASATR